MGQGVGNLVAAELGGRRVTMALQQPLGVEPVAEGFQGFLWAFDGLEGFQPQELFLQRWNEPLGNAASLRFTDE